LESPCGSFHDRQCYPVRPAAQERLEQADSDSQETGLVVSDKQPAQNILKFSAEANEKAREKSQDNP